jgi:hypothetical protein
MRAFFIAQTVETPVFSDVFSENLLTFIAKCGSLVLHLLGDGKNSTLSFKSL